VYNGVYASRYASRVCTNCAHEAQRALLGMGTVINEAQRALLGMVEEWTMWRREPCWVWWEEDIPVIGLPVTLWPYYPDSSHLSSLGGPSACPLTMLVNGAAVRGGVCRVPRLRTEETHGWEALAVLPARKGVPVGRRFSLGSLRLSWEN